MSVLKQTYKKFELIVIDDIPQGNTEEIISDIGVKII
jgi:glycosyltransferase involved in cell wall biosynthesis